MIKKYYSKYTGKQIDEAVAALIENNVKIEDLNEEVIELINSKANEGNLAALKEEVNNEFKVALEDLVGSASEPTPVPTSGIVETVYFNRSLTAEQVNEICSQLTFNIGSTCTYTLFRTAKDSVYIAGYWDSTTKSVYGFEIRTYNGAEYMNNEWQDYATNGTGIYEVNEEITYAGTQNDLLVNLVSITPFTASKGRVGELEAAVEELHNGIGELEEVGLHIMTQNHVLCPYIAEDIVKLVTNQVSMTHRKMTTEEINFFTELKGNSTSKIAIPVGDTMIYAKKVSENDSADLKTMNYIVLSGTESYTMNVILRSDSGEDLNNTIDIFKYTFAEKHNIDTLETEVEELKNKSALIRCDSLANDFLLSYMAETLIDRNLTTEEIEVFSKFINNETLIGVYGYTDQFSYTDEYGETIIDSSECILYKESSWTADEANLTFSTEIEELKYRIYITLGNTNTIYAWSQNAEMISSNLEEMNDRVEVLESTIGDINTLLDDINGEVM